MAKLGDSPGQKLYADWTWIECRKQLFQLPTQKTDRVMFDQDRFEWRQGPKVGKYESVLECVVNSISKINANILQMDLYF